MVRAGAVFAASVCAVVVVACGGGGAKTVVRTETVAPAEKAPPPKETQDCPKFDSPADVPNGLECSSKGVTFTIVHQDHVLKLKNLRAHVEGVRTADTLTEQYGGTETANGRYLVVTLSITNLADGPEDFGGVGGTQTFLIGKGKQFSENFDAENQGDDNACLDKAEDIQPEETKSCDVVYDLPLSILDRGRKRGFGLGVAAFGVDVENSGSPSDIPHKGVGLIILEPVSA
jgi:Domain of unknown function (DUF4352)